MRNATRIIASLLFALAAITFAAAESRADETCFNKSDRIITPEEYAQLELGTTTLPEAKVITGASGVPMDPPHLSRFLMERAWKTCARSGWVMLSFEREPGVGYVLQRTTVRWS